MPLTHRDLIFLAAKMHGGSWGVSAVALGIN